MQRTNDVIDRDVAEAVAELRTLVSLAEAARFFGLSTRTMRRWVALGRLRSYKTSFEGGGRMMFLRNEIARALTSMRHHVAFGD